MRQSTRRLNSRQRSRLREMANAQFPGAQITVPGFLCHRMPSDDGGAAAEMQGLFDLGEPPPLVYSAQTQTDKPQELSYSIQTQTEVHSEDAAIAAKPDVWKRASQVGKTIRSALISHLEVLPFGTLPLQSQMEGIKAQLR